MTGEFPSQMASSSLMRTFYDYFVVDPETLKGSTAFRAHVTSL